MIGPVQSFFAVTAPGLETLCREELSALPGTVMQTEVTPGGVAFKGRLTDLYRANLDLRTPTRILMRIARFRASNFRQMERHLMKVPWELHMVAATELNVNVKAVRSRLYHTDAIGDRILKTIHEHLGRIPRQPLAWAEGRAVQTLFVRIVDDRFVISLDASGAPLYKRGLKAQGGRAPLRENLAAAALLWAGYTGREPLMDPMCGSGTFSLEAALMATRTPPGWRRDFAFMNWPAFRTRQWAHLKKERSAAMKRLTGPNIFASDEDPQACASLRAVLQQHDLSRAVSVRVEDFFKLQAGWNNPQPGIVALNPPYGIRLGSRRETRGLYTEIAAKLRKDYRKWCAAVLLPDGRLAASFPSGMKQRRIAHGGLKLTVLTGQIN